MSRSLLRPLSLTIAHCLSLSVPRSSYIWKGNTSTKAECREGLSLHQPFRRRSLCSTGSGCMCHHFQGQERFHPGERSQPARHSRCCSSQSRHPEHPPTRGIPLPISWESLSSSTEWSLHPSLPPASSIPPSLPHSSRFPGNAHLALEICPPSPSYLPPFSFIYLLISLSIPNPHPLLPFFHSSFSSPPTSSLSRGLQLFESHFKKKIIHFMKGQPCSRSPPARTGPLPMPRHVTVLQPGLPNLPQAKNDREKSTC